MRRDSFDKLVVLPGEAANRRGSAGAILPELCVYCTLWYLAGGSYLDICDSARISQQSSFYRVVWKTITAIVKCNALRITFPKTEEELEAAAAGFASVSTESKQSQTALDLWTATYCPSRFLQRRKQRM
jgi:hypothetical protein